MDAEGTIILSLQGPSTVPAQPLHIVVARSKGFTTATHSLSGRANKRPPAATGTRSTPQDQETPGK
jgi:hypothetical protein